MNAGAKAVIRLNNDSRNHNRSASGTDLINVSIINVVKHLRYENMYIIPFGHKLGFMLRQEINKESHDLSRRFC